jgi:nucleotide-binding universal stress UspA family protein
LVSERDSVDEIENIVREEKIDLLLMVAHEEGRVEHALCGGENDTVIRKMPCSILLVKQVPDSVEW